MRRVVARKGSGGMDAPEVSCGAVRARGEGRGGEGRPDRLRQGGGRNSTGYLNRNAGVPTGGARGPWATGGGAERGQKRERGGLSTTKVVLCSTTS